MKHTDLSSLKAVSPELIKEVLSCYRDNCKYLQRAGVYSPEQLPADSEQRTLLSMKSELYVPESCYIDDTGHFNSVEFNICYNQMIYVLMAYGVKNHLLDLGRINIENYTERMLPDILILDLQSKFKRSIHINRFYGTVSIHRCASREKLFILKTSCQFFDDHDGDSFGEVTLGILKGEKPQEDREENLGTKKRTESSDALAV